MRRLDNKAVIRQLFDEVLNAGTLERLDIDELGLLRQLGVAS